MRYPIFFLVVAVSLCNGGVISAQSKQVTAGQKPLLDHYGDPLSPDLTTNVIK
jgi:hypothetical protein